tara:strand:+ start:1065 stop:1577 length:513 start_codon:yes stop_codon:yes gene_type:complete
MKVEFDNDEQEIVNKFYQDLEKMFYNFLVVKVDGDLLYHQSQFNEVKNYTEDFIPIFNGDLMKRINEETIYKIFDDKFVDYAIDNMMEHINASLAKQQLNYRILHFYPEDMPANTQQMVETEFGNFKNINTKEEYNKIKEAKKIEYAIDNEVEEDFSLSEKRKHYESVII